MSITVGLEALVATEAIVVDVDAARSNSARTATMTAEMSYISRGHSLTVWNSASLSWVRKWANTIS